MAENFVSYDEVAHCVVVRGTSNMAPVRFAELTTPYVWRP